MQAMYVRVREIVLTSCTTSEDDAVSLAIGERVGVAVDVHS